MKAKFVKETLFENNDKEEIEEEIEEEEDLEEEINPFAMPTGNFIPVDKDKYKKQL